jgi:mercuric reductase
VIFDLVVIGTGSAAREAGRKAAAEYGASVAVVERGLWGGSRPNVACAPTELAAALEDEGVELILDASVDSVGRDGDAVRAPIGGRERRFAKVMLAAGRRPNIEALALDRVGILATRGGISVDRRMRTSVESIWAAGDVTDLPQLSPVADFMGRVSADDMFGEAEPANFSLIPTSIFTDPELAGVGLTEEEAVACNIDVSTVSYPLEYLQRAFYIDETHGVFKIVFERDSRRVVGIHVVSRSAGDVVQGYVHAIAGGITVDEIAAAHNVFPTFAEGVKYAARRAQAVRVAAG